MSFVSDFAPDLDAIRSSIPTDIGVRSATLIVRKTLMTGSMIDNPSMSASDKQILSSTGDRYKVRSLSTKDVAASGGLYQSGDFRMGPITPPFPGSGFTKDDLVPPSVKGQDVLYGITDQTGQTQWCEMVSNDTVHDLHWYIVLRAKGLVPST